MADIINGIIVSDGVATKSQTTKPQMLQNLKTTKSQNYKTSNKKNPQNLKLQNLKCYKISKVTKHQIFFIF